jgi:hypothetical protein
MNYAVATPVVVTAIPSAASSADLTTQLVDAFLAGGWTTHAAITGGSTLQATSPQGYLVWLDIWTIDGATCGLKLHSAVGSGCVGFAHQLHWDASYAWRAITHPCGWFIARPGVGADIEGSACMGGIPMVSASCGLAAALGAVSEVWFSFGDWYGSPFFYGRNPRTNIDVGTGDSLGGTTSLAAICACWDGVMGPGGVTDWNAPQILRFSPASADDIGVSLANDSHPLFYGEAPMIYPAFIAWPGAPGSPVQIRGQVYNAAAQSATAGLDVGSAFGGFLWRAYTGGYFWGTLWAMTGAAPQPWSYGNLQY